MSSPDLQIYPDEYERLARVQDRLGRQFEFTTLDETNKRIFEMAAHTEFGEAGFLVEISWQEIVHTDPETNIDTLTGVWLPQVEITGRNRREVETDHDRIAWGVVKGLADGQAGFVREDGSKHEDPIRKDIL